MTIDPHQLLSREFPVREHTFTERDTMLYALGIGLGADPTDPDELRYVYEEGLIASPTLPFVLGYPGFWAREPDTGIDWRRLLNAEQSVELHARIPVEGTVIGHTRITGIVDKGPARGALMFLERRITDASDGALLATVGQVAMLRGNGGQGGTTERVPPAHSIPDRAPDASSERRTMPQVALLYRLNGDYNPLHADPKTAAGAGFERPILHGLCTFGVAAHTALSTALGNDAGRFRSMRARFTAPVYPGETLRTDLWIDDATVSLRTTVVERGVVALDRGRIDISH
jgi:acyl dehydratase